MLSKIKKLANDVVSFLKNNVFNIVLSIILIFIFILSPKTTVFVNTNKNDEVEIFTQDGCYHCNDLDNFLKTIDTTNYKIRFYNITNNKKNQNTLLKYVSKYNIPLNTLGTPIIFHKNGYRAGFINNEENKNEIIEILKTSTKNSDSNLPNVNKYQGSFFFFSLKTQINNLYSVAIILLVLSVMILFNNKHKANLLLLCFFTSSIIMNFLFMIEWLNAFSVARWTRLFNLVLGLLILFYCIKCLYHLVRKNGKNVFESKKDKLSNFIILLAVCLSSIRIITITVQNEEIFNSYMQNINNFDFLKYLLFMLISFISSAIIALIVKCFHKLLENFIFNNNNCKVKFYIFDVILLFVGIYLTFVINY